MSDLLFEPTELEEDFIDSMFEPLEDNYDDMPF